VPPPPPPPVRVCFNQLVGLLGQQLLELDVLGVVVTLNNLAKLGAADRWCQVKGGGDGRGPGGRGVGRTK